jgi:hypothetical protein
MPAECVRDHIILFHKPFVAYSSLVPQSGSFDHHTVLSILHSRSHLITMHFSRSCLLAVASALTAFAQNSFKIPPEGLLATAGKPFDIEWNPTTSGKITLILRSGSSTNLDEGEIIASKRKTPTPRMSRLY